jgi:hypothetical protein
MISPKVHELCTGTETVSSLVAKDPELAPGDAWKKLYAGHTGGSKESIAKAREHREAHTAEDLKVGAPHWLLESPADSFPSCITMRFALSTTVLRLRWSARL